MEKPYSLSLAPKFVAPLEPEFQPASLWSRAFKRLIDADGKHEPYALVLERPDGSGTRFDLRLLVESDERRRALNARCLERLVKFLLWQSGGRRLTLGGKSDASVLIKQAYAAGGAREFDAVFLLETIYGGSLELHVCDYEDAPHLTSNAVALGRHLEGCRIGFDLGGSDRKAAALIDGEVVYSEEIKWDPYFKEDPSYHFEGIRDSLRRAAKHLPRVDAIGGSAAGVYVDNEVRAGSLFRGVPPAVFQKRVRRIFFDVMEAEGWADVPWVVVNDGEVTALAGSMSMEANSVLGISMGTSEAAGYVDAAGNITKGLNELAFAPIDYNEQAPVDEWSGDRGCGVQYFSQQCLNRLCPRAGLKEIPDSLPLPEKLEAVQELMARGDHRAVSVYDTIGVCLGYAIPHYAEFYGIEKLLILGRVTSGAGGDVIVSQARKVLEAEFPALAEQIELTMPDEKNKRHGQAIAAASLPSR